MALFCSDFFDEYATHVETMMTAAQWDVKVAIDAMVTVIQASKPPPQLLIGCDAKYGIVLLRMLPQWLCHLLVQACMPSQMTSAMKEDDS